jgi:hypothetical protein
LERYRYRRHLLTETIEVARGRSPERFWPASFSGWPPANAARRCWRSLADRSVQPGNVKGREGAPPSGPGPGPGPGGGRVERPLRQR